MRQRGFVLVAMLGLLLVTSSLALAAGMRTRARLAHADRFAGSVRAEAAARTALLAAIDSASWWVLDTGSARLHNRNAYAARFDDVIVTTEIADLASRFHINTATETELRQFLVNSGIDARGADVAAQSIADWQDPDQLHRPRGAEAEWYRSAGFHYVPSGRPIVTWAELGNVRGVTPDVLDVLETHGSLYGDGMMNVNSAPVAVLASLPGMSLSAAAAVAARRADRILANIPEFIESVPDPWRESLERVLPEIAPRLTFEARDVEMRTRAVAASAAFRIEATVHHTGEGRFVITRTRYSW